MDATVKQIAQHIVDAMVADEASEGCDLSAGLFGTEMSKYIRELTGHVDDSRRLQALRNMMGYIECGEGDTVKLYQDDATRDYFIDIGAKSFYGKSFKELIDSTDATLRENPSYQAF